MGVTVLHDYILIERLPQERMETTGGGIIVPNRDKDGCKHAVVIACGPGRVSESGVEFPQPVAVGDCVLTYPNPGVPHRFDNRDMWFIRPADILAIVAKATIPADAAVVDA